MTISEPEPGLASAWQDKINEKNKLEKELQNGGTTGSEN